MSETSENIQKHQIPSYHARTDGLLGATIGKLGHFVKDLQSF